MAVLHLGPTDVVMGSSFTSMYAQAKLFAEYFDVLETDLLHQMGILPLYDKPLCNYYLHMRPQGGGAGPGAL